MSLFMAVYLSGQLVATAGPLPYGRNECNRRAAERFAVVKPVPELAGDIVVKDIKFRCEFHARRPEIPK